MADTHNDIWLGDSRELVTRFHPESIQTILTDPPFGVDNQSNMATTKEGKEYARKIAGDESPEQAIELFAQVMHGLLHAMKPESDIYVFTSWQVLEEWLAFTRELFAPYGYERKAIITWEKDGPGMGDLKVPWGMGCEYVLYYKRGGRDKGITRRNSVIHIPQLRPQQLIHPHEKPLPLLEMFINASTDRGDWIVDPFGGSCSTGRAAERVGRNSICIEYDEKNFELAKAKKETDVGAGMDFGDD